MESFEGTEFPSEVRIGWRGVFEKVGKGPPLGFAGGHRGWRDPFSLAGF